MNDGERVVLLCSLRHHLLHLHDFHKFQFGGILQNDYKKNNKRNEKQSNSNQFAHGHGVSAV